MSVRKQFLFYCPQLYPCTFGGMEIFNFNLVLSLMETYPDNDIRVITSCEHFLQNENANFLPLKNKLFISNKYGLGAISTVLNYIFSGKLNWRSINTIYIPYTSNFNYNVIAFLLLHKLFKIQYVIHIHGGGMKPWKSFWLQKLFFKNAKNIAGVSWPIVKEYSNRSKKEVIYLPPLLPFKISTKSKIEIKWKNKLECFENIILFVGSLKPLKGPDTFVNAVCQLGNEFLKDNKIGVVILGDGSLRESLQLYVKENNCEDNFRFTGKVPNEEVSDFYAIADIFVISSWFEGTPIVLLEAMYNSLVCLGSDVNGINTIIKDKDNGLLFKKNNANELSGLLKKVVSEKQLYKGLAINAKKEFDQKYSFKKNIVKIFDFITEQ